MIVGDYPNSKREREIKKPLVMQMVIFKCTDSASRKTNWEEKGNGRYKI